MSDERLDAAVPASEPADDLASDLADEELEDEATFEMRVFVVGHLQTMCYAVISNQLRADGKRPCLVVDPGASGAAIAERLDDVAVELVVATHGHADHVSGVAQLCAATGAPFAMAAPDVERACHARQWTSHHAPETTDAPAPDRLLAEGDEVSVGALRFRVIAVPGHTPGGIVLAGVEGSEAEGIAFVGDTLFAGSVGRTDLAGGDQAQLMASLARLVRELPDETILCCGHGDTTTMAHEKATNPYLRGLS